MIILIILPTILLSTLGVLCFIKAYIQSYRFWNYLIANHPDISNPLVGKHQILGLTYFSGKSIDTLMYQYFENPNDNDIIRRYKREFKRLQLLGALFLFLGVLALLVMPLILAIVSLLTNSSIS